MIKRFLSTCMVLFSAVCFAEAGPNESPNTFTHGPYLCDMTENGVTIVWTSSQPSLSWVEVAPVDDGHFYKMERPKYFQTKSGKKMINKTLHSVRVSGLKPGTTYRYRVFSRQTGFWPNSYMVKYGSQVASPVSDKRKFTTFSPERKDVSFVVLNDIHGRSDFLKELCGSIDFDKIDFVSLNGDMTTIINKEEDLFKNYIDACTSLFASKTPIMFNRGNHETRGRFSDRLNDYFPTTTGEFYQVYYHGDICFLVLDCGEDKPDTDCEYSETAAYDPYREQEARWLKEVVSSEKFKNARARIVFLHIPPATSDWHGDEHLRQTLIPILNEAGIDLMFSGHTHRYSFHPADEATRFPVLVNSNEACVRCTVKADRISLSIEGPEGKKRQQHEIPLKEAATPAVPAVSP